MIPIFKVFMAEDVEDFVMHVLHSGYIGEGEQVQLFEKAVGKFIGNENVVAVNSGTAAITMALKLAGVGNGDFVMSTPMTCLATNEPILSLGAVPVWVDIFLDGTMHPSDLSKKIEVMEEKPKAILCMDWGGYPCNMETINFVARQFDIPVIQDSCQSIGSIYKGEPVGNQADFTVFSFQAIKHLTTVDGGALVIKDKSLVKQAQLMRWFGLDRTKSVDMRCYQDPPIWGYKFHMNDVSASIGLANIRHLNWILLKARNHADVYNNQLCELDSVRILRPGYNINPNYWLYTVIVNDPDDFIAYMKSNDVMCSKVHDRNDTKTIFKNAKRLRDFRVLPGVDFFDDHHVCIPVGWWLEDGDVDRIVELIKQYDKEYHESDRSRQGNQKNIQSKTA